MKHTKSIYVLMVVLTTLLSMWVLPSLVKKMTDGAKNYPFVYYSSILKELCVMDFVHKSETFSDIKGNEYPRTAYDSLLPLLNFRQLMMNGTLPDSLEGQEIEPKNIRMKQLVYRFYPAKVNSPQYQMGVLLEAMPKRLNLALPGDYFRMDDRITFIDATTNTVDESKSERFTEALTRKGFSFPVKHYWGNPTTRKPYEEGYFCLDNQGQLFHLKMVNGRPFVKNTGLGDQLTISWFSMHEVSDKRYYGYLFGSKGEFGIVESTEDGGYAFRQIDIPAIDIQKDDITIMGNMLYWTIRVTHPNSADVYAVKASTLEQVSSYHMERTLTLWDTLSEWLFVCSVTPTSEENAYVSLYFSSISWKAFLLNVILVIIFFVCNKKLISLRRRGLMSAYILLTGFIGLLSWFVLAPNDED